MKARLERLPLESQTKTSSNPDKQSHRLFLVPSPCLKVCVCAAQAALFNPIRPLSCFVKLRERWRLWLGQVGDGGHYCETSTPSPSSLFLFFLATFLGKNKTNKQKKDPDAPGVERGHLLSDAPAATSPAFIPDDDPSKFH